MSEQQPGATAASILEEDQAQQTVSAEQQQPEVHDTWPNQDSLIAERIEITGRVLRHNDEAVDVAAIGDHETGILGVVQSNEAGKSEESNVIAAGIAEQLTGEKFNQDDLRGSARRAISRGNELAGELGTPFTGTFVKSYEDMAGNAHAVVVSVGDGMAVLKSAGSKKPQVSSILNETQRGGVLDGTEESLDYVQIEEVDLEPEDRIYVLSPAVAQEIRETPLPINVLKMASDIADRGKAADIILGTRESQRADRDKVVLIQDLFPKKDEVGQNKASTPQVKDGGKPAPEHKWWTAAGMKERWARFRGREKKVGRHALVASGVEEPSTPSTADPDARRPITVSELLAREDIRQISRNDTPAGHRAQRGLWRRANDRAIDGIGNGRNRRLARRERRDGNFYQANWNKEKYEDLSPADRAAAIERDRKSTKVYKGLLLLTGAVVTGIALKKAGMDVVPTNWPFGGDGDGVDYGPWHGKSPYQSTPGNPVNEQWYGTFLDDDPAKPSGGGTGTPPPTTEVPTPDPNPQDSRVLASSFEVQPGSGFVVEIDETADAFGVDISREEAFNLYTEARGDEAIGDKNMILGTGTYVSPLGDLRLSSPTLNAQWTDEMQRFLDEELKAKASA